VSGMRGLSVRQPLAWAITTQGKDVENRSRATSYRGLLAIHASKVYDEDAEIPVQSAAYRLGALLAEVEQAGGRTEAARHLALGAVVAVATLDSCHWEADCYRAGIRRRGRGTWPCSGWAALGQFHWTLTDVRPLAAPVPCKGALGLWTLPDDAERAIRAQLEAAR